ncbi:MAG: hypothetical protein NW206_01565 [Hyphomonadaceae bacterium]|nr:hypothetical protein [Hyphomonadaceae bacterium]
MRASAGLLPLPNNPLIVAAVQAICCGGPHARLNDGGWRTTREGFPYYEFWSGSGGRIGVRIASDDPDASWRLVESLSTLTLDVAIALLSGLSAAPFRTLTRAPRRGSVRLGPAAVLAAKQYRRYGAERIEFAEAIAGETNKLMQMRFDIHNYPGFNPKSRSWSRAGISRTDVALIERGDEAQPADPLECSGGQMLRFGAWADHWLNAGGPMWVSMLPQAVLALDHRDNRGADVLAKKTALLIALNWGALRRGKTIVTDVRTFLRRIGELRRPSAETLQHSGRIADRFDEALFRLADRGLIEVSLLGEAAALLRSQGRRWFDTWLEAGVIIQRPSFIDTSEAPDRAAAPHGR